ncbi:MAG: hypothetical protein IPN61_06530 [Bacteroidetes bacterium]|nr:hypothetical protein [Bacteroidota bacterium]
MVLDIVFQSGEFYNNPSSFDWTKLLAPAATMIGVYVAYRAFNNYDIKKLFKKRQLETVIELILIIEASEFTVYVNKGNSSFQTTICFNRIHSSFKNQELKKRLEMPNLIFSHKVLNEMKYLVYANNPFCPKIIANEIKKLTEIKFEENLQNISIKESDYVHLKFEDEREPQFVGNPVTWGIKNPELQTIESYLHQIMKIKLTINKWLKKFDIDDINLNLEPLVKSERNKFRFGVRKPEQPEK